MARAQAATKSTTGNGVPRELTAGPPEGVPRGLVVAAAWTWRVLVLALAAGGVVAGLVGAFLAVPLAAVAGAVISFARS